MHIIEILCIGNELLSGITLNTNAHWLSKKITRIGGFVRKVNVIRDDLDEINLALTDSLKRKPSWRIGKALKKNLVLNNIALDMVKKSYNDRHQKVKLNEARLKMAKIPVGSTPIQNPVGNAPAVLLSVNKTRIICLPGVPNEMKAIVLRSILHPIKEEIGNFTIAEINYFVQGISEAMISSRLTKIVASAPNDKLYLKTHPQGYVNNNIPMIRIQIVSKGTKKDQVTRLLEKVSSQLSTTIRKNNGKILKII